MVLLRNPSITMYCELKVESLVAIFTSIDCSSRNTKLGHMIGLRIASQLSINLIGYPIFGKLIKAYN